MTTALGYASWSDWGVHFGLGGVAVIRSIEIQWPGGVKQVLADVKADQILQVIKP